MDKKAEVTRFLPIGLLKPRPDPKSPNVSVGTGQVQVQSSDAMSTLVT
jgi:hypothetical protein